MIHHPLILRELLVGARQRSGFWIRIAVSVGAVLFGLVWLLQFQWIGKAAANGAPLFRVLSAVSWAFALVSGPLMTADSISSERREGTLGLLHLSRISPREIVLSKFVAAATRLTPILLGMVPVMVLCLLMGGLTFGEIFRAFLAIALTAALSLAAGLLGSAAAWHGGFTTVAGLALLVFWNLLPPTADAVRSLASGGQAAPLPAWASFSPANCLASASSGRYAASPGRFWAGCAGLAAVAVLFLAGAAFRMRRAGFLTLPGQAAPSSTRSAPTRRLAFADDRDPLAILTSLPWSQRLTIWLPAALAVAIDVAAVAADRPVEIFSATMGLLGAAILTSMAWHRTAALQGLRSSRLVEVLMILPAPPVAGWPGPPPVLAALRHSVNQQAAWALAVVVGFPIVAGLAVLLRDGQKGLAVPLITMYFGVAQILRYHAIDALGTRLALGSRTASRAFFLTVALAVVVPTVLPCLVDWALLVGLMVWGGTGENQRRWLQEAVVPPARSGPATPPQRTGPLPLPTAAPPADIQPGAGQ